MSGQESTVDTSGLAESFQESLAEIGEPGTQGSATEDVVEQEASPDEEPRFSETDPEKIPEAAQEYYKNFQRDYTKKMQALASERKALEAKKARVDAWEPAMDAYDRNPEIREKVDAAFARVEKRAAEAGVTTASEFDKFLSQYDEPSQKILKALGEHITKQAEGLTKKELETHKAELAKVNAQLEATQQAMNEQQAAIQQKRFERAHPDWKESLSPRQQKLFMIELWENPESDPSEVYESLVQEFDKGASKVADKAVAKLVDKAGNRPLRTPGRTARGAEVIDSMHDAFKSALREMGR